MLIKDVDSSAIKSVAYNADESKMWLRFSGGSLYEYREINSQIVNDLLDAESKGKFFREIIKDKFEYEKVNEEVV